jgi:hypothetical protein
MVSSHQSIKYQVAFINLSSHQSIKSSIYQVSINYLLFGSQAFEIKDYRWFIAFPSKTQQQQQQQNSQVLL